MKSAKDLLASQCEPAAGLLKAIAHPVRLKMLCALADGEKSVTEIEDYCGASQSSVSQYLGKMKSEDLLQSRRNGQHVIYKIKNPDLLKLMRAMQKIFC